MADLKLTKVVPLQITKSKPNEQGPEIFHIESTGDSTIKSFWPDVNGSMMLEANDGSLIIVPFAVRKFLASKMKDLRYSE